VQIDWFTLLAQVVNFLVLVWLLKRFLYGRILSAMAEREARIVSRLEEAAQQRAAAEQEAERYRTLNQELAARREQELVRGREEAELFRLQRTEEARAEVARLQEQWLEALHQEQQDLLRGLRERIGQEVVAIARRALRDLAGAELEQQVLKVFLEQVRQLDPAERQAIVEAIHTSDREVEIRSVFGLGPEAEEHVRHVLREQLGDGVIVRFETVPALGCGIELRAHAHRLAWNLDAYLEALEDSLFQQLEERAKEDGKPSANGPNARPAPAAANGPQ
jgi:F-type H+-transporting ATPase subunit b